MGMKRRISSLLLCIVMVLSLIPTAAFAAGATTYKVWVGGVQITSDNMNDVLGDGKVSYDPAKSILTLNNANIAAVKRSSTATQNAAIYTEVDLIIRLAEGSVNTVTADLPSLGYQYGIYTGGIRHSVYVQGNGVLNVTAADTTSVSYAIYSMVGFEVSYGAVVNAVSGAAADSCALKVYDGDIIVSADSVLNAKAGHSSAGGQSYGIKANTNAVWVQSGKLTAQGDTLAVEAASLNVSANEGLTTRIDACSDYAGTQTADYDLTSNKYILAGAFQPVTEYNVWVGNQQITDSNKSDVLGDGKISFDIVDDTPTLTILEGAKISGAHEYSMIYAENTDLVINAPKGLTMECAEYYGVNVKGEGNLTIKGNVNITPTVYCYRVIYAENGSITINGDVKVQPTADVKSYGYSVVEAEKDVTVVGCVDITGYTYGLYAYNGSITVNGDVKAQTEWSGLHTNNYGTIKVDGNVNITVSADWTGIYANYGSVSIGGNATIKYVGTETSTWEGISVGKDCKVTGDTNIEGFKEGVHARGGITLGSAIIKAKGHGLYSGTGSITMVSGKWDITSINGRAISAEKDFVIPDTHSITAPEGGIAAYGTVYESDGTTAAKHVVIAPKCPHTNTELRGFVAPTCTAEGCSGDIYCMDCGKKVGDSNPIPKMEHYYVTSAMHDPTCTEDGYGEMTCKYCGDKFTFKTYDAFNHPAYEPIPGKAATCTETGLTEGKKCVVCGETLEAQEIIPAKGHHFVGNTCDVCGYSKPSTTLLGDVNNDGRVNQKDVARLRQFLADSAAYPMDAPQNADVNNDGKVNQKDVARLRQFLADSKAYPLG